MVAYAAADIVSALGSGPGDPTNWGAVSFAVTLLLLWGGLLLAASRGLLAHQRWAFTPVVFTQLMFAVLAVEFLPTAASASKGVWAAILVSAVVVVSLSFSRPVRQVIADPRRFDGR